MMRMIMNYQNYHDQDDYHYHKDKIMTINVFQVNDGNNDSN